MNKLILISILAIFALISCGNSEVVKEKTVTDLARTDNSVGFYLYIKEKVNKFVVIRPKEAKAFLPNVKGDYNDDLAVDYTKLKPLSQKEGEGNDNFVVYASEKNGFVNIKNLQPNTKYAIDIYSATDGTPKLLESFNVSTFAAKPTEAADNIMFTHVTDSNIGIGWKDGNGTKRLVLMCKDTLPVMPKDGQSYFALPEFGNKANQIPGTNTYVVYNGSMKKDLFVDIKIPEPGKYFFYVAEYNGDGESAVYNLTTSKVNPRFKLTKLIPPIANNVTVFLEETYMVGWSKVPGAEYYEVQVAYDKNFTKFVETYEGANVGDNTEFEIYGGESASTFYYRVRAVGDGTNSEYSNAVEVKYKPKK